MHENRASRLYRIFDKHGRFHEMTAKILPWNIIDMKYFVFKDTLEGWPYASQRL